MQTGNGYHVTNAVMRQKSVSFLRQRFLCAKQHGADHTAGIRSGEGADAHGNTAAVCLQGTDQLSVFGMCAGNVVLGVCL